MPHKPIAELLEDNRNLLRDDAAAASIQPSEVRVLLDNIAETSDVDTKANADAAVMAQTDATAALSKADAADIIAKEGRATANDAQDKIGDIERDIIGVKNELDDKVGLEEIADWAEAGDTSQIPANKLGNAPGGEDATARTQARAALDTANAAQTRIDGIDRTIIGINNEIDDKIGAGEVADWAEEGDVSQIPANKLANAVDATARNIAGQNTIKLNAMPVFATTTLSPSGVRGTDLPTYIALELANKIERRNIIQVEVYTQGQLLTRVNNVTSAALITQLNSHGGIINIEIAADIVEQIANNLQPATQDLRFLVQYKFEGTSLGTGTSADQVDEVHFGVQNDSFLHQPELIGSVNFSITSRNVFSSGASELTVPTEGFGLINMGRRSASQARDGSHHIIDFAMLTALTASTHAAAATNINSFVFVSSNQNYRIGRTNGNRLLVASNSIPALPVTLYRL